jgi:hypothetical protein
MIICNVMWTIGHVSKAPRFRLTERRIVQPARAGCRVRILSTSREGPASRSPVD